VSSVPDAAEAPAPRSRVINRVFRPRGRQAIREGSVGRGRGSTIAVPDRTPPLRRLSLAWLQYWTKVHQRGLIHAVFALY
jgi:hypothetical protein